MRRILGRKGMTLMEVMSSLIITVAVIGALSAILVPAFRSYNRGVAAVHMDKLASSLMYSISDYLYDAGDISLVNTVTKVSTRVNNIPQGSYDTTFTASNELSDMIKMSYASKTNGGQFYVVQDDSKTVVEYVLVGNLSSSVFYNGIYYTYDNIEYSLATSYTSNTPYYTMRRIPLKGVNNEYIGKVVILRLDKNGNVYAEQLLPIQEYDACSVVSLKFNAVRVTVSDGTSLYSAVNVEMTLTDSRNETTIVRSQTVNCSNLSLFKGSVKTIRVVNDSNHYLGFALQDINSSTASYDCLCFKPKYVD